MCAVWAVAALVAHERTNWLDAVAVRAELASSLAKRLVPGGGPVADDARVPCRMVVWLGTARRSG